MANSDTPSQEHSRKQGLRDPVCGMTVDPPSMTVISTISALKDAEPNFSRTLMTISSQRTPCAACRLNGPTPNT